MTFFLFFIGLSFLVSASDTTPLISAIILGLFGLFLILASFVPRFRGSVGSIIGMLFLLYVMGSALSYLSNFINEDWWQQDWIEQKSDEEKSGKSKEKEEVEFEDPALLVQTVQLLITSIIITGKKIVVINEILNLELENYFQISKNKRNSIQPNTSNSSVYWNKIYSSMVQ